MAVINVLGKHLWWGESRQIFGLHRRVSSSARDALTLQHGRPRVLAPCFAWGHFSPRVEWPLHGAEPVWEEGAVGSSWSLAIASLGTSWLQCRTKPTAHGNFSAYLKRPKIPQAHKNYMNYQNVAFSRETCQILNSFKFWLISSWKCN